MIDGFLDAVVAGTELPALLVIFLYPIFVHIMYALIWNYPGIWFPGFAPEKRVRLFALQAYCKQVVFFSMFPWYMAKKDVSPFGGADIELNYFWRVFALALAQPPMLAVAGVVMGGFGLFLEGAAFKAIGETAIMYGCKLGPCQSLHMLAELHLI
eukprot:SAG31_NODE_9318_length_1299_cov_1.084167_2_plen_155_part_00